MSGKDDEGVGWYNVYVAVGDEEYVCGWYVFPLFFFIYIRAISMEYS